MLDQVVKSKAAAIQWDCLKFFMKNSFSFIFKERESSFSQKQIFSKFFASSSSFSHLAEPSQPPHPKPLE